MAHQTMTSRSRVSPKTVLKSVGPPLVPFFKSVALFFIIFPQMGKPSLWFLVFKCAPICSLILFVLLHGMNMTEAYSYARKILIGLVFSLIGDMCLVYSDDYFVPGLAAFAIAHVSYTLAFGFQPPRWQVFALLVPIAAVTYAFLYPGLNGSLVFFAGIYVMIIGFMLWRAVARVELFDDLWTWTKLCSCAGAILFCVSDLALSIDKFVMPYSQSHVIIMSTYYAAQVGITLSIVDSHVHQVILD